MLAGVPPPGKEEVRLAAFDGERIGKPSGQIPMVASVSKKIPNIPTTFADPSSPTPPGIPDPGARWDRGDSIPFGISP